MSPASVRAPSAILAELSETKVPGEPLYMSDEDGWRPYLPLVDDFLSALQVSEPVRFFTSSGVTQVTPPRTVWQRYRTAMILTVHFAHYAKLRNWTDAEQTPASSYVRAMETLGFQVEFLSSRQYERTDKSNRTYRAATDEKDQSVHRFFGVLLPFAVAGPLESVERVVVDFVDYFNSIYQNSLVQLFLFMFGAAGAFMATHLVANYRFRYARTSVPICIGGWGTRGKSGTERLKAALINALGYSLISKSSGCEAMFIMGETYGEAREIIIYRPYDKATIWEQHNLMLIAAKSQRDVFLWECMGLTPAYVDVLQRQWTRDDLSTITNAYPDHEDVQGPSGWDVARTISGFVPRHSTLVTSEQQMLPLLREECVKMKTRLHTVNWIQSGLLTDDVLARFPYLEHPDNIALVTSLAELLGCHADFALKEMADRLIPDLGVLKTYPPAPVRTRRLEFINGMSANERYGCINNWKRMGFDRQDPYQEPGTWITTVVNNRADRVPRSRVFARILVFDISADRHYLIGNNLKGLQGFIWEAWEEYIANVSLWSGQNSQRSESPQEVLQRLAIRFRQPFRPEHVQARFAAMLPAILHASGRTDAQGKQLKEIEGLWNQPDRAIQRLTQLRVTDDLCRSVLEHLTEWNESLLAFQSLSEQISATSSAEQSSLDRQLHALLRRWFARKLVVVEDYHATGDEVISAICAETPAGFLNRIMGVQNIKGTGLDFVYRWLAWEKCFQACQLLSDGKPNGTQQGLQMLAEFQEFGVLTNELARDTLQRVKRSPTAQREQFQADIELISNRLNQAARAAEASASHDEGEVHWMNRWLVSALEDFLDVGDAVYRRKQADQIYRDLIHQRISWSRAVLELRALSKRQKGGWLADRLRSLQVWLSGRTGMLAHLPTVEAVPEKKPATATTVPHGAAASDSEAPLPRGSARGFPPIDSSLPLPPYQPDFFEETY
ncbi:MAG: hypothetical protein KDA99_10180 [Planctomycetales bacterium]|nr:hypothetical protein [Planctomycetales bacterium]